MNSLNLHVLQKFHILILRHFLSDVFLGVIMILLFGIYLSKIRSLTWFLLNEISLFS